MQAPGAGKVIAVEVGAGQSVRQGDSLLVVEAMKLETPVRAPCHGVVREVRVAPGALVQTRQVLVIIEPSESPEAAGAAPAEEPKP